MPNRRGFVFGATVMGVIFAPFIARARNLMLLRGPQLYVGPRLRVALVPEGAIYDAWKHRIVEVPFEGTAEFGARYAFGEHSGLVLGMTNVPVAQPAPIEMASIYRRNLEGDEPRFLDMPSSGVPQNEADIRRVAEKLMVTGDTNSMNAMLVRSWNGGIAIEKVDQVDV